MLFHLTAIGGHFHAIALGSGVLFQVVRDYLIHGADYLIHGADYLIH